MARPITRADVEHVAQLARLALDDDEVERFTRELGVILEHAEQVAALDTHDVPPTAHPLPLANVLRADAPHASDRPRAGYPGSQRASHGVGGYRSINSDHASADAC